MSILERLKLGSSEIAGLKKAMPDNAKICRLPENDMPFKCLPKTMSAVVIEKYDNEAGYKLTYIIDLEVAKQLSASNIRVKQIHTLYTQSGEVRLVFIDSNSKNSWPVSALETVTVAKEQAISISRNHDAKVYEYKVEDGIEIPVCSDEQVEAAFDAAFQGEYYIQSLDHPMVRDLAKKDSGSVVLVAEIKSDETQSQPGDIVTENAKTETFLVEPELVKATNVDDDDFDLMAALEITSDDSMGLDMNMDLDDGLSLDDLKM
ncbi:hypothetical protein C0W88_17235 [Photobacterium leiognathi subsp. mandapamensis]|uniref:hypothetical protein n=1 Tax=Photobacterium leiognathi TaxID=553611 RepID=UPI000D16550C|nr:hypothetical protein [Photobacterium leiognathi]PSW63874.1 hypothetical protein C0W88_17235 [Photobacterium leiognathi subsp. mandapamensis]